MIIKLIHQRREAIALLKVEIQNALKLAIPSVLTQLAETATGFVDLMMMGWLGTEALAAGGLGVITFQVFFHIGTGLFEGLGALAAEAFGREDIKEVRKLTIQGLWLCTILSLPIMLLLWNLGYILSLLGQKEQIARNAEIYLRAILWGLPAVLGLFILKEVATAGNRPQFIATIATVAVPLNALANYSLMFGHFGFPALGLAGAGWSSTVIFWLTFLMALAYTQFHPHLNKYQVFKVLWYGDNDTFLKIFKLGIPLAIQFGAEFGLLTLLALFMGYLGTDNLAAHEITFSVFELAIIVPFGFSYSTAIRIGQRLGLKNIESIKNTLLLDLFLNTLIGNIIALIIWLFSSQIISIYLDSSSLDYVQIKNTTIALLGVAACCQGIYGLHLILIAALQGIQDTLIPMWINISAYWLIGVGGSYFFAILLDLGAVSIWLSLTLALVCSTSLLIWRFFSILSSKKTVTY